MRIVRSPIPTGAVSPWEKFIPRVVAEPEPGFQTCRQIALELNRSECRTRYILLNLVRAGHAETRMFKPAGSKFPLPHYRLKPQPTNEKEPVKNKKHRRYR